jgi:hypothetical protein
MMDGVDPELLLGNLALEARVITPEQLRTALGDQARDLAQGKAPRQIGVILLAHGWISEIQLMDLLREQAERRGRRKSAGPLQSGRP